MWGGRAQIVNLLRSPGIDFQHGGPVRQPYIWRTGPPGYIGWRNDSWPPLTFTYSYSSDVSCKILAGFAPAVGIMHIGSLSHPMQEGLAKYTEETVCDVSRLCICSSVCPPPRLWKRNDLLRFRRRKSFGSGSGSRHQTIFSTVFQQLENLAFSMSEAASFTRKLTSHFRFVDFFYSILCWIRIQIRFRNRNAFWFRGRLYPPVRD